MAINIIPQSYRYIEIHWTTLFNNLRNIFTLSERFFSEPYSHSSCHFRRYLIFIYSTTVRWCRSTTLRLLLLLVIFSLHVWDAMVIGYGFLEQSSCSVIILCQRKFSPYSKNALYMVKAVVPSRKPSRCLCVMKMQKKPYQMNLLRRKGKRYIKI